MTVIMRIRHGVRGDRLGNAPMIVRDHLDDMISPIDGKPQTSKRAYYRQLRQAGCEIVESPRIRPENRPGLDQSDLKSDIVRAMHEEPRPLDPVHIPELDG